MKLIPACTPRDNMLLVRHLAHRRNSSRVLKLLPLCLCEKSCATLFETQLNFKSAIEILESTSRACLFQQAHENTIKIPRVLKVELAGDFSCGATFPKIRIQGKWLAAHSPSVFGQQLLSFLRPLLHQRDVLLHGRVVRLPTYAAMSLSYIFSDSGAAVVGFSHPAVEPAAQLLERRLVRRDRRRGSSPASGRWSIHTVPRPGAWG